MNISLNREMGTLSLSSKRKKAMIKAAQSIGVGENKYPSDPHVKQTVNKGMRFEVNGGSSCLGRLGWQPCHNATWAVTSAVHPV